MILEGNDVKIREIFWAITSTSISSMPLELSDKQIQESMNTVIKNQMHSQLKCFYLHSKLCSDFWTNDPLRASLSMPLFFKELLDDMRQEGRRNLSGSFEVFVHELEKLKVSGVAPGTARRLALKQVLRGYLKKLLSVFSNLSYRNMFSNW